MPGRPTIWIIVGQGPTALAVGACGVVWTFFLSSIISFLAPPLWETIVYTFSYEKKAFITRLYTGIGIDERTSSQPSDIAFPQTYKRV